MNALVAWVTTHWFLAAIFFSMAASAIGGFIKEVAEILAGGRERRHERELARENHLASQILAARQLPKPGPCVHRNVAQVRDRRDVLVAWYCKSCDTQLPKDWAIAEEDL